MDASMSVMPTMIVVLAALGLVAVAEVPRQALATALAVFMAVGAVYAVPVSQTTRPPIEAPAATSVPTETSAPVVVQEERPDEIGFFDPTFDYRTTGPFKVGYLVSETSFLTDGFDRAFADWAIRMNINYTGMWAPASGSGEEYLAGMEIFADQGYTGLILDPDLNIYPQVAAKCESLGIAWVSGMGQAREAGYYTIGDETMPGRLLAPTVGFDNLQFGIDMMDKLIEWKYANFPDVPWEKVGVISVDFSPSSAIHERTDGAELRWTELFPQFGEYHPDNGINPNNFWIADTVVGTFDQVTAQNLIVQILLNTSDIEVWLIPAALDEFSMGAANAAENLGMTDVVCTVCVGGSSLAVQWDSGVENAWRYALFAAQPIYAEPMMASLWAQMAGQVTREELWPDWVKKNDKGDIYEMDYSGALPSVVYSGGRPVVLQEHNYASLLVASQWLDRDNYKSYLEWVDMYAYGEGAPGHYGYEDEVSVTLNAYSARAAVSN